MNIKRIMIKRMKDEGGLVGIATVKIDNLILKDIELRFRITPSKKGIIIVPPKGILQNNDFQDYFVYSFTDESSWKKIQKLIAETFYEMKDEEEISIRDFDFNEENLEDLVYALESITEDETSLKIINKMKQNLNII